MSKIFIATKGKTDYLVVPNVMATKLTRYYWMAVNSSVLPDIEDWGNPPRSIKMPSLTESASEQEVKDIISGVFGKIVAERGCGENDQGWVGLIPDEWQQLIERHGMPN